MVYTPLWILTWTIYAIEKHVKTFVFVIKTLIYVSFRYLA